MDRQILRSLQVNPRVPFALVADVLGVAEQTVARRYRAMLRAGSFRVVGAVDPDALGLTDWIIRLRCRPDGADSLAAALARREDVSWLNLASGGAELQFSLRSRSDAAREDLLLRLPRSAPVLDVAPLMVLHRFMGGRDGGWVASDSLTDEQQARLALPVADPDVAPPTPSLDAIDHRLLDELSIDGRTPIAALAKTTGISPGRVARRLAALERSQVLYYDVDVSLTEVGAHASATIWAVVEPRHLDAAGRELATHPNVPFCVALTGPHNLSAVVMARSNAELYEYVTSRFGRIDGVISAEVSPRTRQVKQARAMVKDGRLAITV